MRSTTFPSSRALIECEGTRRLAALEGSMPGFPQIPRRRSDRHGDQGD